MSSDSNQETWEWKAEPASPASPIETSSLDTDDYWFTVETEQKIGDNGEQAVLYEEQTSRAQVATKLLKQLDEWIKEEPYPDWLEQKIDLPIFEELSSPDFGTSQSLVKLQPQPNHYQQHQETTRTLLQEFESVLGDVEACHHPVTPVTALTPPQSPPAKFYESTNAQILITPQPTFDALFVPHLAKIETTPLHQLSPVAEAVEPILQWSAENVSLEPLGDVASELAAVDEIVRSCVEDITPSSPSTSSDTSCASFEDSIDDPEWMPEISSPRAASPSANVSKTRQRKPYSRPSTDDRKVRKKEQNKNAATRYRQKKKQEIKEIVGEEQELTNYNDKLQSQVGDLQREIRYLKGLMRDLFKVKGLIK